VWRHATVQTFRHSKGRYFSFAEREEIAISRAYGYGIREIARHLGVRHRRSPGTCDENAGTRGGTLIYRAEIAQWHRDRRAARPKTAKLVFRTSGSASTCRTGWPA
jgi:hypothetical protein